jgi:hypothetical protein
MAPLISFLTIRDTGCCGGNVESDRETWPEENEVCAV